MNCLFVVTLYVLLVFQQTKNLIVDEWLCDANEIAQFAIVIQNSKQLQQSITDNGIFCSETGAFARTVDFKKYTVLAMLIQPGNYCNIKYYRKVVFDKATNMYAYTLVANGIGVCKRPSIATVQFVMIPKTKKNQLVKFRFEYVASAYGKELAPQTADKMLNAGDDKFVRVIVM